MDLSSFVPDGYIGIAVSSVRNDSHSLLAEKLVQAVSLKTGYKVVAVDYPGMGAAAGGPLPGFWDLLLHSYEIAGYLGAAWQTEKFIRRKYNERIDKKAREGSYRQSFAFIALMHGALIKDSSARALNVRDLVAILPIVRDVLVDFEDYSILVNGKSNADNEISFFDLNEKNLRGRSLKRMTEIACNAVGPISTSGEKLNMLIFKPEYKLY